MRLATAAALVAGAVSLASEIVWTRALVFFVHNSTYAFSAIVAVYLLGIAAGALVAARFARSRTSALRSLAVDARRELRRPPAGDRRLPTPSRAGGLPRLRAASGSRHARRVPPGRDVRVELGTGARDHLRAGGGRAVPAGALLGAVFPLTLELAPASDRPARLVGRLYAVNALGCVAGAVLGTFVLVALLGTRGALLLLAWLPVPIALWALREAIPSGRPRTTLAGIVLAALAGGSLLAAPRGFYEDLFEKRFGRVVWFAEGVSETVAVCEHKDGSRWIQFSDGRGASGTWSFQGGWLYAHLPLLLHPRPRSAAVICFGTGNTLGAASLHPLEALDGIELSPEVVKAAPLFAKTNHDVATSGRARIVIEDGRSYMLATDRRYDVVTEEPPLVHTAGVVNLYSRDFYELCSRRLTDDGIMAVWLATWELESAELRMLVRAFVDAFPHASLWDCTHPGEWLLIGSKKPLRIDLDKLAARMAEPAVARDLARIDADAGGIRSPADILSLHLMGHAGLAAFAGDARPVTDDRSVVDFTTPRHARANFGLGEWVTGGLSVSGVGERGLQSELLLREFDRVYTFREPVDFDDRAYDGRDPGEFAGRGAGEGAGARDEGGPDDDRRSAPGGRRPAHHGRAPARSREPGAGARSSCRRRRAARSTRCGRSSSRRWAGPKRPARRRPGHTREPEAPQARGRAHGAEHPARERDPAFRRSPLAVPGRSRPLPVPRRAPPRAAPPGHRLWRADGLRPPAGGGRTAPLPEQPAIHLALLRPGRGPRAAALLARRPEAGRGRPASSSSAARPRRAIRSPPSGSRGSSRSSCATSTGASTSRWSTPPRRR